MQQLVYIIVVYIVRYIGSFIFIFILKTHLEQDSAENNQILIIALGDFRQCMYACTWLSSIIYIAVHIYLYTLRVSCIYQLNFVPIMYFLEWHVCMCIADIRAIIMISYITLLKVLLQGDNEMDRDEVNYCNRQCVHLILILYMHVLADACMHVSGIPLILCLHSWLVYASMIAN